jgi:type IX secretion system PorP/SprF family membrane protein
MNLKKSYVLLLLFLTQLSFSQEGVPVYSDYLTDNYYLLHPSMAGAASCAKLRLTARQQWFGQEDAPSFQTLSFNGRVSDRDGLGIILLNDRNGYHSQKGVQLTYAHHIMFSRDAIDLNQLSFGVSAGFVQSLLDETEFLNSGDFDPNVDGTIEQKASYFNVDIGASYNFLDFYAHFTVKNVLANQRKIYSEIESDNLRKFLLSLGYTFGDKEKLLFEPSVLLQLVSQTKEKSVDLNLKAYKELDFGRIWGGISYRRSLDGAQYVDGNSVSDQRLQYITPLIGVNYKNFMFAYTYSALLGNIKFDNGGFHQITLGINLFCEPDKYECNCPAIN